MTRRKTDKDGMLGAQLPFWKLVTILERQFENTTWTTPDVDVLKIGMRSLGPENKINQCHHYSRSTSDMIVVVNTVINGHRPKAGVSHVGRSKSSMNHDSVGFIKSSDIRAHHQNGIAECVFKQQTMTFMSAIHFS